MIIPILLTIWAKEKSPKLSMLSSLICSTKTSVQIASLDTNDLKENFSHALKLRGYTTAEANPRFLQGSSNIKIEGTLN